MRGRRQLLVFVASRAVCAAACGVVPLGGGVPLAASRGSVAMRDGVRASGRGVVRVRLDSFTAAKPIVVELKGEDQLRVVGEWLGVLALALSSPA